MKSILEKLSSMTVVVADTGDLDAIKKFKPRDATTNPSLILAAAKNPHYAKIIDQALERSMESLSTGFSESELIAASFVEWSFSTRLMNHCEVCKSIS